eukprot:gene15544-biopygen4310
MARRDNKVATTALLSLLAIRQVGWRLSGLNFIPSTRDGVKTPQSCLILPWALTPVIIHLAIVNNTGMPSQRGGELRRKSIFHVKLALKLKNGQHKQKPPDTEIPPRCFCELSSPNYHRTTIPVSGTTRAMGVRVRCDCIRQDLRFGSCGVPRVDSYRAETRAVCESP